MNPFLCNSTATGVVQSNLSTTPGTVDYALVVDFSAGFDAPCNVVDETAVFTFQAGTITVHSHHQDCPATIRPGPRIDTEFVVTSGTGTFVGATGSGAEHGGQPSSTTARSSSDGCGQPGYPGLWRLRAGNTNQAAKIAVPPRGVNMRKTLVVSAVVVLALLGTAASATLPQVDPATVPTGNLVANNSVSTPLKIKVDGGAEHVLGNGTEVFIRHLVLPAGGSTGWHTHLGPVLVTMVRGSLTLYDGDDKTYTGVTYTAGHGFIDRGFGHVHLARNERSEPADFYATYLLPPDGGDTLAIPASANPNCPSSIR